MTAVFALTIGLDNAAVQDADDIAGILREVAGRVEDGETDGTIRDLNGNTVGAFKTSRAGA